MMNEHENHDVADLPDPPSLNPDLVPTSGPYMEHHMDMQPPPSGVHQWPAQNHEPVAYNRVAGGRLVPIYESPH